MAALISLTVFLLLAGAITLYGYKKYVRPVSALDRVAGPAAVTVPLIADTSEQRDQPWVAALQGIGEYIPISPQDAGTARRYLIAAGYRSERALYIYYGIKVVACVAAFLFALLLHSSITSIKTLQIVFTIAATAVGYFGPNLILEHMVSARQERIRFALPDALDLMVVCVEAGLGLDQAILSVGRELAQTQPDLSDEFNLVTLEMRAGKRRGEALRNLSERTGESDLRKLVALLVQTDRFGTSMADSLRSHSDFMRMRRSADAEERANKVGVKLIFPIFFFVLPSMILVAAGPALIQIFRVLRPLMRSFGS